MFSLVGVQVVRPATTAVENDLVGIIFHVISLYFKTISYALFSAASS